MEWETLLDLTFSRRPQSAAHPPPFSPAAADVCWLGLCLFDCFGRRPKFDGGVHGELMSTGSGLSLLLLACGMCWTEWGMPDC